jgi:hypothetical protein
MALFRRRQTKRWAVITNQIVTDCFCYVKAPKHSEILVRATGICNVTCTSFTRTNRNCSYCFHIMRCDTRNHIIGCREFRRMLFKSHHIQHRLSNYWTQCSTLKTENLLRSTIINYVLIFCHLGKEI